MSSGEPNVMKETLSTQKYEFKILKVIIKELKRRNKEVDSIMEQTSLPGTACTHVYIFCMSNCDCCTNLVVGSTTKFTYPSPCMHKQALTLHTHSASMQRTRWKTRPYSGLQNLVAGGGDSLQVSQGVQPSGGGM